jgi:WD40 repeat protein
MVSAIDTFLASFLPDTAANAKPYQLAASLDGHGGPINTLAFNTSSTLLASGGLCIPVTTRFARKLMASGDDEEVKIWDLKTYQCFQTLLNNDRRWGQITTIKFINRDATPNGTEWLCFGTGRGQLLVYHRSRRSVSKAFHLDLFLMSHSQNSRSIFIKKSSAPGIALKALPSRPPLTVSPLRVITESFECFKLRMPNSLNCGKTRSVKLSPGLSRLLTKEVQLSYM